MLDQIYGEARLNRSLDDMNHENTPISHLQGIHSDPFDSSKVNHLEYSSEIKGVSSDIHSQKKHEDLKENIIDPILSPQDIEEFSFRKTVHQYKKVV